MTNKTIGVFYSISLILTSTVANAGTIYAINSENDALESINTLDGTRATVETLDFFSQGQVAFDTTANKAYLFNGEDDRLIQYNFSTNSSSNIVIDSNSDQILSVFGIREDGTLVVLTDDFGEEETDAKRFGLLTNTGELTRIGVPLVNGSAYPQGNQLYDNINNKIYTISNDSSKVLSVLDLDAGQATSFASSASSLIAFAADENKVYGAITGTESPTILVTDLSDGTETTLTTTLPSGFDNFASSGFVDIVNDELAVFVGGAGVTGIAVYSTVDGSFKRVISTAGTGRFFSAGVVRSVVSGTETFSDNIESEIGEFIKLGDGTLNVISDSASTDDTSVLDGTLKINGSFAHSTATVSSGASLAGAGTVGGIINNGNLEPGNSIGTLNVSGGVTLNTGSVLVIEVDAAGNSDKIVATGAVTAGGTLRLSPASGTYSDGQQYTIITGSSVSGAFSTVTVLSCSGTASASYGSTAITVTLSNCALNAPKNRETISSYVNDLSSSASGDLNTVLSALNTLSDDQYNKALDALDYNTSGAIASVAQSQISSINSVIGQRVAAVSGGDKVASMLGFMTRLPANDYLEGLSFEDRLKKMGATGWWALSHGGVGDKKSLKKLGVNGYDYTFVGTTFGYDKQHDNHINGTAVTIQIGSIDSDNGEGDTDHTTFSASKYLSRTLTDGTRQSLTGSFAVTHVDSNRRVRFASIDRTAKASYDSIAFDGAAEHSYSPRQMLGATHNFSLQGGLTLNFQEGFTERGAGSVNLKVAGSQTQVARAGLVDTIYWSGNEDRSSIPFVTLGIHASHHLGDTHTKQRFVNQNSFTSESDKKTNAYGEVGFGFLGNGDEDTEISFVTKGKFSDKLTEFSAMLQYTKKF